MSGAAPRVILLGAVALLAGCARWDRATTWGDNKTAQVADGFGNTSAKWGMPWGGSRPKVPEDSLTVARVMGAPPSLPPLRADTGNIWPAVEGPRTTLANPEAALRGIPDFRPGESPRQPEVPRRRVGSSSPPPPPDRPTERPQPIDAPPPMSFDESRPRRADGRALETPQGAAVTTGGTDRIQGYTTPGGGVGTAIRDGNTTTFIGPDGQATTRLTPR